MHKTKKAHKQKAYYKQKNKNMNKLTKIKLGIFPIIILAVFLMSFIPMSDKDIKQETATELVPSELPPASGLYVS